MRLLFDLLPVILFFIAYKLGNQNPELAATLATQWLGGLVSGGHVSAQEAATLWATLIAILATLAQVAYLLLRRKKIEPMLWISLLIILLFGGATIWLHNEAFIKWKPTVLYWLFSVALLGGVWIFKKNLMRLLLGSQLQLPEKVWQQLNALWASFFVLMGGLNLYIAYTLSTNAWVNFKLFGFTGLTLVFVLFQAWFLSRHLTHSTQNEHPHSAD
jgi:intracellular septation protein